MSSVRSASAGRAGGPALRARDQEPPRRRRTGQECLAPFVFLAPAVLILVLLRLWPLLLGVNFSFTGDGGRNGTPVGLSNYLELFDDPVFRIALRNVGLLVLLLP